MKTTLRRLLWLIALVAVVSGLAVAFWPKPVEVDAQQVTEGPLLVTVDDDGQTRIKEKYIVSAPLAGRLLRVDWEPGDEVTAQQTVVATIQPSDPQILDARAVAEAEARLQAAEAAAHRAEPAVEQARIALEHAETELARKRQLRQTNAVSQQELYDAEVTYRLKVEEHRAARFAQEIADYEWQLAKAALLRTRPNADPQTNTEWQFQIPAPIHGRVLRVFQESTAVVAAGTPLLELGDPQDLEVVIDVLSVDAVKVQPGDRVIIDHWGGPYPLEGRVRLIEPAAFTKISALGVEEQRVNVIIDLVDPPAKRRELGDAFRIEGQIVIWESDQVLRVPTAALFRDEKQRWSVFSIHNGRARQRLVQIGHRNEDAAEVLEGLTPDELVIVHPSDRVADGVSVRVR